MDETVWINLPCFFTTSPELILPAFLCLAPNFFSKKTGRAYVVVLLSINRELRRSLHFASSTLFYYFTLYINIFFLVCRLYRKTDDIADCVISAN